MTLITVPIKTFSAEPIIKLNAVFGVWYDSDTTKVIELVKEIVNSFEFVKEKDTTKVFVSSFAASRIEIKTFFSFDPNCGLLSDFAIGYINEKIGKVFNENKINMPFNTFTVNFDKGTDMQNVVNNLPK
jgi:small-conductance mechanosensitive channel